MITEAEIRIYNTGEYLGLWKKEEGRNPALKVRFKPERLEKLKNLDDLAKITIGYEITSAAEFKKRYLNNGRQVELDQKDSKPKDWNVSRRY